MQKRRNLCFLIFAVAEEIATIVQTIAIQIANVVNANKIVADQVNVVANITQTAADNMTAEEIGMTE